MSRNMDGNHVIILSDSEVESVLFTLKAGLNSMSGLMEMTHKQSLREIERQTQKRIGDDYEVCDLDEAGNAISREEE